VAKQQHVSRKDVLSKPDPSEIFARRVNAAIDWGKDNFRYILYGLLGLLVVALSIVVWSSWQRHRSEQASLLLHQALKLVDEDPNTKQPANPDQAIERLQAITKEYGRTPAGARAYWHLGHLYYAQGKMSEALESYQTARHRLSNQQPLSSTLAILNIAYAQEATDACGEAIASYESVLQSPIHWLRGEAYLGMGRCHEKNGATEKAIEDYDRALADVHVTGAAQQTISERLARLRPEEPATPVETPVIKDDKSSSTVPQTPSSDTAPSETAGEAKSK
jgi:predicted negative regulator of RcsB-dependent stress response